MTNNPNTRFDELLASRQLLLVTGKGGTGKTLLAGVLARRAAKLGRRVLVAEASAHDAVAHLFGAPPIGHHETALAPGISGINLSPLTCFEEYVVKYRGLEALYARVFDHALVRSFLKILPGLGEVMLLGRLFYSCVLDRRPFDTVIFDGPASGHFLSLLRTPQAILESGLIGPLVNEVRRVFEFLGNPERSAVIVVTGAEELMVAETLEFVPQLEAESPAKPVMVVANRLDIEPPGPRDANPALGAVYDYLEQHRRRSTDAHHALDLGLTALGWNQPSVPFPDLGIVTPSNFSTKVAELKWA